MTVIRRPAVAILATGGVSAGDYDVAKRDITYPLPGENYLLWELHEGNVNYSSWWQKSAVG